MAEREKRRGTIGQNHIAHDRFEIDLVFGEIAHMPLAAIAQHPPRQALPTPIEGHDGEAAAAQVAHHLEIFLDEFRAPLEDTDGALAPGRRRPARIAQENAVTRLERATDDVFGHRIGGNGDECHREAG